MSSATSRYRIGLTASPVHQSSRGSALARLLHCDRSAIDRLRPEFLIVDRTLDAVHEYGMLEGYPSIARIPDGQEAGLVTLVSRIVETDPTWSLDAIIYLMDPVDPSSNFPESLALKRQCVIHGKPFLSTLAGAREWLELEAIAAGAAPNRAMDGIFELGNESVALIAHDAMKDAILEIAERHFDLLDAFGTRYATGTTGGLLNQLAQRIKGEEAGRNWVRRLRSGPLGGDAQIAELIVRRKCRRVLFLEDPHVARQHEADIQLLERAARAVTDYASCASDVANVTRWLTLLALRCGVGTHSQDAARRN